MKEYSNDDITVCWDPDKCIHSRNCVKGLPQVFDKSQRPWINMQGASSEEIMKTIDKCPSGALSYKKTGTDQRPSAIIKVIKNGPLLVEGECALVDREGGQVKSCGPFALCRCGGSKNKPFCDGAHTKIGFDDGK